MSVNASQIGRTYPAAAAYQVSRAKIAEFTRALGDQNPAYQGTDPIAPPTFAAVIAAECWNDLFADPDLGMSLARTMHADQRFDFIRPLRAGDEVVAQLRIVHVRQRQNLDLVKVAVDLTTDHGEELGTATSTLIHTRQEIA